MSWAKKFFIGFSLLVVIVVGFLAYGIYNVDGLVKSAIEKYGSEAVAGQVTVGFVKVDLQEAKVILKQLKVGNPEGFTEKTAFSADYIEVDLDGRVSNTSKITIRQVVVKEPLVTYEHANGEDNLSKLQKNAVAYAQRLTGADKKKETNASGPKVFIGHIDLNDGKILLKDSRLMGASVTLPLPNIHISKIQTGPDGSSPEEIAGQIMENLFSSSKAAVGQSAPSFMEQGAKDIKDLSKDLEVGVSSKMKKLFSRE